MPAASIALVSSGRSSFVEADAVILAREYEVRRLEWSGRNTYRALREAVRDSDLVFCWFAGDHAAVAGFVARRHRRPVVLVAGGADVAAQHDIGYGAMAGSWRSRISTRLSIRLADLVLPFSEFSASEILRVRKPRRMEVLYLGVDVNRFAPLGAKEDLAVTAGAITESNLRRKGHATFVEASRKVPGIRFVLAGAVDRSMETDLRSSPPPNLELPGYLSDDELLALYRRAKVYVQASAHEGFGLAVAEAMACGCVPVVTRRGSLPEVVGDTGVYVEYGDADSTAEGIRTALSHPADGTRARERVVQRFPIGRRADRLLRLVSDLLAGGR